MPCTLPFSPACHDRPHTGPWTEPPATYHHPIPSHPVLSTTTHSMPLPLSLPLPLPPPLASRPTAYPCTQPHPRRQVFVRGLVEKQKTHLDRVPSSGRRRAPPRRLLLSSLHISEAQWAPVESEACRPTEHPPHRPFRHESGDEQTTDPCPGPGQVDRRADGQMNRHTQETKHLLTGLIVKGVRPSDRRTSVRLSIWLAKSRFYPRYPPSPGGWLQLRLRLRRTWPCPALPWLYLQKGDLALTFRVRTSTSGSPQAIPMPPYTSRCSR